MSLKNISKLGKILKSINRVENIKEFNNNLPIKIKVKEKLNPIRYKIILGKKEIETKSYIPLEVGKEYFAEVKTNKNHLNIQNLKETPKILKFLEQIDLKEEKFDGKKENIINKLQNSSSKIEFLFYSNILLSLIQHKTYHFIIKNNKRKSLIQYKYHKNKIKFYAIFPHLNEIEGEIFNNKVNIFSPFESTISLINFYKNEIDLEINLFKKEKISMLYEFSENLINLKA